MKSGLGADLYFREAGWCKVGSQSFLQVSACKAGSWCFHPVGVGKAKGVVAPSSRC